MRQRLQTHKEETPQVVALYNQTNNMEKILPVQPKESIDRLLQQLQKQTVVDSSEATQLEDVHQGNNDEFVNQLVSILSKKEFGKLMAFTNALTECDVTEELGTQLKEVLLYCKNVSGRPLNIVFNFKNSFNY